VGWLFSIARTVAKLGVILVGAVFLRNVSAFLLTFVPMPASVSEVALTLATFCYLAAFAVLVFGRSVRGMKWPVLLGFGVVAVVLAAGGLFAILVLVGATPNLAQLLAGDVLFGIILLLFSDTGWLRALDLADRSGYVAAIEVHRNESEKGARSRMPFGRVLSALALADVPVGFRFQYLPDRHARLFFFTWAPDEPLLAQRQTQLRQLLAAHLPGVTLSPGELPAVPLQAQLPSVPIYFRGTPGGGADGFAALQAALNHSSARNAAIVFQVFAAPAHLGRLDEWATRRRVENHARSARHLLATAALLAEGVPPPPKQAEALSKPAAVARAQQVLQQLRRLDASDLLATQVALIVWHPTSYTSALTIGESLAARLASALQAATPSASVTHHAPWRPLGRRQIRRLLRAVPAGSTAYLLPAEAAAYLGIP
jgi:hypothetical protein